MRLAIFWPCFHELFDPQMPSEHEQNSQVNGSLIPKWNNERRTEAISETKDAKGGEYCLATQHGGQQERQSIRQEREEALQRPGLERFSKRQCGSHKMRRTIRYLGSVKKTFHFLCSLFQNQTTTSRYTNNYSTRETLSVHVLFRCILPFLLISAVHGLMAE